MTFLPGPPNTWKVTHVYSLGDKRMTTGYYVSHVVAEGEDLNDWLDHVANAWAPTMTNIVGNGYSFVQTEILDATNNTGLALISTIGAQTYSGSDEGLPPECSVLLSLRTGNRGRSYRGRMFLPACTDVNYSTDPPGWVAGSISSWNGNVATWLDALAPASTSPIYGATQLGVMSKRYNKLPRPDVAVFTPVAEIIINPQPCSQRRRQTQHKGRLR